MAVEFVALEIDDGFSPGIISVGLTGCNGLDPSGNFFGIIHE